MAQIAAYRDPAKRSWREKAGDLFLHRIRFIYRTFLILAALAVAGIILYRINEDREYTGYEVIGFAPREATSGSLHEQLGRSILVYSKDGAHGIDDRGEKLWDVTFEMQDPRISISGDKGVIYDENGQSLYLVEEKQVVGEIKTTLSIRGAAVSQNGNVAAVELDGEITWINVYDPEGNLLVNFKTSMSISGYPLAMALSPDSTLFAVSFLYADRGQFKSSVGFYNFGSVGQNYTDKYVSGYDYVGQVVPVVGFIDNETAYAVSDSRLMFYSGKEIPMSQREIMLRERVLSVFSGDGHVNLVFPDTSGQGLYRVDTYNKRGDLRCAFPVNFDYTDIVTGGGAVMVYNLTECCIYSLEGKHKLSATFNSPVLLSIPRGGYHYILVTAKGIENIRLY